MKNKKNGKKILLYFIIAFIFIFFIAAVLVSADGVFGFITSPKVVSVSINSRAKSGDNPYLVIDFDKPIKRQEIKAEIYPEALGEWMFKNPIAGSHLYKTLVFAPAVSLGNNTKYEVKIENIKGIASKNGSSYQFAFEGSENESLPKANAITMLNIPMDYQDDPLSCEAASLKMALAYKGVYVTEDEIMEKIGYDPTPRVGNIWGDPYQKYVGNIKGKICATGYGVYWDPVAVASSNWRESEAVSNFKITDLTREIKNGNPIIFWGVMPNTKLTDCSWYTKDGKYIKAIKQDHVRLVTGFVGTDENPSLIIINDPLSGQLYWPADYFMNNWKNFDYSGVVVR